MTELRKRFMDDMTLHGLAPTTRTIYVNAVKQLAAHYRQSPDQISEQQLRDYFTHLIKVKRVASSTLRTPSRATSPPATVPKTIPMALTSDTATGSDAARSG